MTSPDRLFIVDPSLKDTRGHHYSLTKSISSAAIRRGIRTIWLASKDASEALDKDAEVVPTFELTMYAAYMKAEASKPMSILDRVRERLRSSVWRRIGVQTHTPETRPQLDLPTQIFRDLRDIIDRFEIGVGDHLLFHSADGATYEALARLMRRETITRLPMLHVCTPYDPIGVMPNRTDAAQLLACVEAFRELGVLGTLVNLYAENAFLAEHLSKTWLTKVKTLSLPAEPFSEEVKAAGRLYRTDQMNAKSSDFVAVSLGAARLEKGFDLLPDIIEHAFEIAASGKVGPVDPHALKFVLHASPQIIGRHPQILAAIDRLTKFPEHQVKLLLEPLSNERYRALTLASDCILMPYDPDAYRVRGSGIVTEAIVAQRPILAKSGSYPAMMAVAQYGSVGETPIEMAHALVRLMHERDTRAEKIKAFADDYLAENSPDQYIDRIWRS